MTKALSLVILAVNNRECNGESGNSSCGVDSIKQNEDDRESRVRFGGIQPKHDYTREIDELKQQLPQGVRSILENSATEIRVLDDLYITNEKGEHSKPHGIYTSNKIRLDSKHVNFETLLAECIHAIQDNLGMTVSGTSNLEFQEHVVKDVYHIYKGESYSISTAWDENGELYKFIINSICDGRIDLKNFSNITILLMR
ncbi:MAG: hypothetical protein IJY44_01055 [Bacteroidaceae bacterium]|nr:hypothetical protein [Bacteroidaceae bacterium]